MPAVLTEKAGGRTNMPAKYAFVFVHDRQVGHKCIALLAFGNHTQALKLLNSMISTE
jgi:hypothetical protein